MKTVIVGASPVGCLFAGLLAKNGEDVFLLDRDEETISAVNGSGLKFEGSGGVQRVPVKAGASLPESLTAELVLVCVRVSETGEVLDRFADSVGHRTSVVSLQDGVGGLPLIINRFGIERVFACSTNLVATILEPGHVLHSGWGDTRIACTSKEQLSKAKALAARFTRLGIKSAAGDNMAGLVWTRTIVQCGFYALTAITQLRNGSILEIPEAVELMEETIAEAARIVRGAGVVLLTDDLSAEVRRAIEATADNHSPMLSAIFRNKPTDVEVINGAVVDLAGQQGAGAPINATLLNLVRAIEKTRTES